MEWKWKRKRDDDDDDDDEGVMLKYCKVEPVQDNDVSIACHLTPMCSQLPLFTTLNDYEVHYSQTHEMVCKECRRILPSAHLLDLHLCEVHDSYFAAVAARQANYECFVDGCSIKSKDPLTRIDHLIHVHSYPRKFDFDVVLGSDLKKNKKKSRPKTTKDAKENHQDMEVDQLTDSFAKLAVPRSVSFGHQKSKMSSSQVKRAHELNAPKS